jgi:hypothetical protein
MIRTKDKLKERPVANSDQTDPVAVTAQELSAWPGGWYVYENGRVDGPFSADETFAMSAEAADGKPRLISRKGFTQWYALKDLSEIFRMTEQLGRKAIAETERAAMQIDSVVTPPPPPEKRVEAQRVEVKATSKPTTITKQVPPVAPAPAGAPPSTHAEAASTDPATIAPESAPPSSVQTAVTKKIKPASQKAQMRQEYVLLRGRLRLGKLRNPWLTGLVAVPLSLGVVWAFWCRDLAREAAWHVRNQATSPLPPAILALIPGLHFIMIYKLAKLMIEMEAQNKYRSVSVFAALIFGIFPPFALAYLQDAANRHWLLHVRHAVVKRAG